MTSLVKGSYTLSDTWYINGGELLESKTAHVIRVLDNCKMGRFSSDQALIRLTL